MITTIKQRLTFEQFLDTCPDRGRYELVDGEIVEMASTRNLDDVADFILFAFNDEVRRFQLEFVVTNKAMIKTVAVDGTEQGRLPDVSVVDRSVWRSNRSAYSALVESIQLAVEVISTNWDDDYIDKLDEYQRLGIPEYWIVDYLAREYLGKPKIPTVFVYLLNAEGKYQFTQFRGVERIVSQTFPNLTLTAEQILKA